MLCFVCAKKARKVVCGACGVWCVCGACVVRGAWCAGVWCVACLHVPHVYNYPPIVFPVRNAEAVRAMIPDLELEALIERSANQRESGLSLW